ncbi:hypothetical protein Tco_1437592 [Tanacetum coccineum]
MDFITKLPKTSSVTIPTSRLHRLRHFTVVSVKALYHTTEKIVQIKNSVQAARDRQKSYADVRRKPLEFQVGDKVMLKVSPWKGVIRFGKRRKLNPGYIGPFKKCLSHESLVIPLEEIQIDDKLHFIEEPIEIIDREVKQLKQSRISIIKRYIWNKGESLNSPGA